MIDNVHLDQVSNATRYLLVAILHPRYCSTRMSMQCIITTNIRGNCSRRSAARTQTKGRECFGDTVLAHLMIGENMIVPYLVAKTHVASLPLARNLIAILRPDIPLDLRRLESRSRLQGTSQTLSIVERVFSHS